MSNYSKEEAIAVVTSCAKAYREHLAGKSLLFVCSDKHKNISCVELTFDSSNFLHLTGLKPKPFVNKAGETHTLTATEFYSRCLDGKLRTSEFDFAPDGTTSLKLDILPTVITKNLSAKMMGDYNSTNPKLYTEKLVGGISACMGFIKTKNTGRYVPNTILKVDIRDYTKSVARVIAVFCKRKSENLYTDLTYVAKNTDLHQLNFPEEFLYLLQVPAL